MIDPKDNALKDQLGPVIPTQSQDRSTPKIENFEETTTPEKPKEDQKTLEEIHAQEEKIIEAPINNSQEQSKEEDTSLFKKLMRDYFPLYGAYITGLGHISASIGYIFGTQAKEKIDAFALNLSKMILSLNCGYQGWEAFKGKRLWEGISRVLEPIFIIAEKRVEDLGLARGIGLGISQLVEAQDGIRQELINQKGLDSKKITMGQDHDLNYVAFKKIAMEIMEGGILAGRRFMTGFSGENIMKAFKGFKEDFKFSSINSLFSSEGTGRQKIQKFFDESGLSHIKKLCEGDKTKDKGHTTALSGYLMILGSIIGYLDKASKGFLYKIGGTIRNIGGIIADVSIFGFPDVKHNMASPFLTVNSFLDIAQRFIPKGSTSMIKTIGNLSMAAYNVGVGIYLDRSNDKTNKEDSISRYDTDLAHKTPMSKVVQSPQVYATAV